MPLSIDLRLRIVAAYKGGLQSVRQIGKIFNVAKDTVSKIVRLERETGSVAPRKGGTPALGIWTDTSLHQCIRDLVAEDNQATLAEYCDRLEERTGTRISVPQMCELHQQLKLYRKKKRFARAKAIARESSKLVKNG